MNIDNYLNNTINANKLHKINKDIFLTTYEINILKANNIPYETCTTYQNILYLISDALDSDINPELEQISLTISERNYYQNTHK